MKSFFISHSSNDIDFVNSFNVFLKNIGIKEEQIFCSSIQGQDVKTGDRIEEKVREKLSGADMIFYIISNSFLKSPFCTAELGAGWILQEKGANLFIIKMPDIDSKDLTGFVNSNYKYTELTTESLSAMIDALVEYAEITSLKAIDVVKNINSLLKSVKPHVDKVLEEKNMTEAEIREKTLKRLHASILKLNKVEKALISHLYFKEDRIEYLNMMDGLVNLLTSKLIIVRLSSQSFSYLFPFTLQTWVLDYIEENTDFKNELKQLKNELIVQNHRSLSNI